MSDTVSLREYIEGRFDRTEKVSVERLARLEQRMQTIEDRAEERLDTTRRELRAAFEASEKAIDKADTATEKRFESVNEFRAQLASQTNSFMPREVVEPRLAAVERFQWKLLGALGLALVFVPLLTALVAFLVTKGGK